MDSLEKHMFFLPFKYKIIENEVYTAFNIAVIPSDMQITKLSMILPVSHAQQGTTVVIRNLASRWDEKGLKEGKFPAVTNVLHNIRIEYGVKEVTVDLTMFKDTWHKSKRNNNGVLIGYSKIRAEAFIQKNPPYLIAETI